ncbi:MAG TPA: hypothetical protein VGP13_03385 [Candidatus Paceibacterota bacterium]|nr:hypothetical protein [Candidatus Paceibacterota bacterium]
MAFLLEAVLLGNYDIYMGRHEPLGKVTCPMVDRQVRESLSPGGVWAEVASQATFACERRQITVGPCSPGKLRPDGIEHCLDEKVARALKRNDVLVCESEMVYSYTGYFASDHKRVLVDTCRVK